MRVSIMQPTFLPWLGWFDIADQTDLLLILDDVAFAKQSWQQRNRLRTPRGLEYVTVPVRTAGRLGQMIGQVEIDDPRFAVKFERTIQANYAKAEHFKRFSSGFFAALREGAKCGLLAGLNTSLIVWMLEALGISTSYRVCSTLGVSGKRGEHVAALCEAVGASYYLSPAGAADYLLEDSPAFDNHGVDVWLHEYEHPVYEQAFTPFIPYASALDLLFNEGDRALAIIRSGRRPSRPLSKATDACSGEDTHANQ